jgi:hypothetical protein
MKKLFFTLTSIVLLGCNSKDNLEIGQKTTLEVNKVFNGGKVLLGEEVEAVFNVKNTGNYPLIISEVKGSCSCTVAEYPEEPIEPGGTDNAAEGLLTKEVRMIANTEPSLTIMQIKANVTRK